MKKKIFLIFLTILIPVFLFFAYFFVGRVSPAKEITFGVNFSQWHAENLGLDWKKAYSALLEDLRVKNLKVAFQWDLVEPEKDVFYFEDLDWQVKEAENHGAKIIPIIGIKTSRWPECHVPNWAVNLNKKEQQKEILEIIEEIVLRYRDSEAIKYWQVENEPLFKFGCTWADKNFLKEEIELVKRLDSKNRSIIISDSGEWSLWISAAKLGDMVGTTLYKKVWFSLSLEKFPFIHKKIGFYLDYPFPAAFYGRKAQLIEKIFGKKVICVELQAEPWGKVLLYDSPLLEQEKTMNLEQFKYNINFAKKTGFDEIYLWGGEWWYWIKEKQGKPEIWQEAKNLFQEK
ncbi:MAG: hypothetical protein PHF44_04065 [Candidatus Pacebacteria bacterium]|nr:hypothetical protein [Candidatus Paceibacterota bacterium]